MIQINTITKQTASDFSKAFDVIIGDFGMNLVSEDDSSFGADLYVRIFKNNFVQLELAGNQQYFHCEIRRLVDGKPKPYSDTANNIGFESLAILGTEHTDDHFDFYPPSAGWYTVLENTATLLKNNKAIFTSNKWVNLAKIDQLKAKAFSEKFGFAPGSHEATYMGLVREKATKLFLNRGFRQTFDNAELPPYSTDRLTQKIVFEKNDFKIIVSQQDWRDSYTCYFIDLNGRKVFNIDTTGYNGIEIPADLTIAELDKLTA